MDNDEWQDLYLVTGWWLENSIYSNIFFHNQGGEHFISAVEEFGLENKLKESSYTYIDIDNDGDLDIITTAMHGVVDVYVNNENKNNLITFELRDEQGNSFGIGTKIYINYDGKQQVREIKSGSGYLSFDAPYAHFGLGSHDTIDSIEIVWSTGEATQIDQPFDANNRYIITRTV